QTVGILDGVGEHVGGGDAGRQRVGGVLIGDVRLEEDTSELQSRRGAVWRRLLANTLGHRTHAGDGAAHHQRAGGVVDVGVGAGRALHHPGQRRRGERGVLIDRADICFFIRRVVPSCTLFPYTTLFRSQTVGILDGVGEHVGGGDAGRQRVGGVLIGDV